MFLGARGTLPECLRNLENLVKVRVNFVILDDEAYFVICQKKTKILLWKLSSRCSKCDLRLFAEYTKVHIEH